MGAFRLGKVPVGKAACGTGAKLSLGKLNPRLFGVHINSPLTNVELRDLGNVVSKLSLYPAVDNMNFSIDRNQKKAAFEFYLYNTALAAQWVNIEVHTPDVLQVFSGYVSASTLTHDWEYWLLSLWDVEAGAYVAVLAPEVGANANYIWNSALSKYLNGATFRATNGDGADWWSDQSAAAFSDGPKGSTGTRKYDGMANRTITYNFAGGCKRRLGIAVNIPASSGLRAKMTVYFA